MHLIAEAAHTLDARKRLGEKIILLAAGHGEEMHPDDRHAAATDAVADVLTAMFGPSGHHGDTVQWDEEVAAKVNEFVAAAVRSWEGDAEDYHVDPDAADAR